MSISFIEAATEQGKSRGIRKMGARNLESGILAEKWSSFQRDRSFIRSSPNLIFSVTEQKKNPPFFTCGLPQDSEKQACVEGQLSKNMPKLGNALQKVDKRSKEKKKTEDF